MVQDCIRRDRPLPQVKRVRRQFGSCLPCLHLTHRVPFLFRSILGARLAMIALFSAICSYSCSHNNTPSPCLNSPPTPYS
jgi:hypothetical protein